MSMLPEIATLIAFIAACLALNFTPGADMMFTIASAAHGGAKAGVAAAVGINLGVVVHIRRAAVGLAALIAAEPLAYDAIRYLGAGYLIWLAWQMWRAPAVSVGEAEDAPLSATVKRGFITNVLNPKTALFIFAFLPQFADSERGQVSVQIIALGAIFICTGLTVNASVGALAGVAATRIRRASRAMNRLSAIVFAGLAARLVLD
ncbi:MAG: LysE family translocator [Pseudomonadota bacterium]